MFNVTLAEVDGCKVELIVAVAVWPPTAALGPGLICAWKLKVSPGSTSIVIDGKIVEPDICTN